MKIRTLPSPNFDSRNGFVVDMLVLHYTDTRDCKEALDILLNMTAKVSSHYVVDTNGDVWQLVHEMDRAWHAGRSFWRGATNINHRSVGIEIVNPGHRYGLKEFPQAQMDAVAELCQGILQRHSIAPRNIVGHSDIAPARKQDPGELFGWKWLAAQGIGLWPNAGKGQVTADHLADYGYDIADLKSAIGAFQRRFRPARIDGVWDAQCAALLAALLDLV